MPALTDYLALITSEHQSKPRFAATLTALLQPLVDLQATALGLPADFDLDTAVGAQLDAVGLWVGRSRDVETPLEDVYFSFDVPFLGFDQGNWQGPYDPNEGLTVLDDDNYRLVLRAKIAANQWDGTIPGAAAALANLFPAASGGGGLLGEDGSSLAGEDGSVLASDAPSPGVFVQDNQDMSMVVGVAGLIPGAVAWALLSGGYVPLKPAGVRVEYLCTTVDGSALFGFDVQNSYVAGFDSGAWGSTTYPARGTPIENRPIVLGAFVLGQNTIS